MSDTEEEVYKQTYHLDDYDSDSSGEVQYIQASDLPKEDVERILATYKSLQPESVQQTEYSEESDKEAVGDAEIDENNYTTIPAPSWLKVACDEDSNEESRPNTIVYKTTYRTSNEQHSSAEAACDEDSNEESKPNTIVYKTMYKTSNEHHSSAEVACDEDLNEEPKQNTIMYKTTYRTSNEQHSSAEVSFDEDSNEELEASGTTYKKIYTTFREQECSEDSDNDPDYEPKEERIKRYKKKQRMFREQKLLEEIASHSRNEELKKKKANCYKATIVSCKEKQPSRVLFGNYSSEVNTANIRKLKKSSIELQPIPGANYIEIPIPNCNQQKFKQTYREEWEKEPYLKDWIQPWLEDSMYAYCKFCKCKLTAHKKSLRDHSNTKKHRKNVFDVTGAWGASNSKPANLTYLMPRARRKTEKILMNDYDGTSLSFANSTDFNIRVINDPLLPISS